MQEERKSQLGLAEEQEIPLRRVPKLPELTETQRRILEIASKRGDVITGSLAQRALLQQRFTRQFRDIDIASKTPSATAQAIKKRINKNIIVKRIPVRTSAGAFNLFRVIEKETGRVIADIAPRKFAEEGFVEKFPTVQVDSLTFVSPQARLAAKVAQLRRGRTKREKIIKDIEKLTRKRFQRPLLAREIIGIKEAKKDQLKKQQINLLKSKAQEISFLKVRKQKQINLIKSSKTKPIKFI